MRTIKVSKGLARLDARYLWAGRDLIMIVTGGDTPHVGAVSMAGPGMPAGRNIECAGHREGGLAEQMALMLAGRLKCKVTVLAGMHWDNFDEEMLEQVRLAWRELGARLCDELD